MEEFPTDLVALMDELSPLEFLKLALYKMNKMTIETYDELTQVDKLMSVAAEMSTKMKLRMISPALRERFFKIVTEKGLDKPGSFLADCTNEEAIQKQPPPVHTPAMTGSYFQTVNQPSLFQNPSVPLDMDPNSFQMAPKPLDTHSALFQRVQGGTPKPTDSEPFNKRVSGLFQNVLESYETELFEADVVVQPNPGQQKEATNQRIGRRTYREQSRSPPAAYRSITRRTYREQSRSPPAAYKSRSSSRSRGELSSRSRKSRSPPAAYRGRSSSRPRPASELSRRSRSPPASYSTRTFTRFDAPSKQESSKEERKEFKGDETTTTRKPGLSFGFTPRRKYTGADKPFKF